MTTTQDVTTTQPYALVEVPQTRRDELKAVDQLAFAFTPDEQTEAALPDTLDWSRTMGMQTADGRLAAVHASHPFRMPVPGGTVAASGLTWVGVRPDHRRRGLLSRMIAAHVQRSLARGEPVSALFAAEMAIYGRFGYGCAADSLRLDLPRGAELRPVEGSAGLDLTMEDCDPLVHGDLVHELHVGAGAGRPGWVPRDTEALRRRVLADPPAWREGGERLRIAVVRRGHEVRGYAVFRRKEEWQPSGPTGTVTVREYAALDAAATHRLWSFLLDLDLMSTVRVSSLPVDDPLTALLVNPRAATPGLADNLWLRLLDLPAALSARLYAAPLEVTIAVTDAMVPANAGTWRVVADAAGRATVDRVDGAAPDLSTDVTWLGAAYLGGRSLAALGAAGLVEEHTPGALHRASVAFAWPVAPVCSWTF